MPHPLLTHDMIDTYQRDGVIVIRGLFKDHVETLRKGVARNMAEPGPFASENKKDGETGRFFDDYCNCSASMSLRRLSKNRLLPKSQPISWAARARRCFTTTFLSRSPEPRWQRLGTPTGRTTSWMACKMSVFGPRLIPSKRRPYAVSREVTLGKNQ